MKSHNGITSTPRPARKDDPVFTVASANKALVLVRRIVQEIVERYATLMKLRSEGESLSGVPGGGERLELIREQIEDTAAVLNRLHDELSDVGCELKDWTTGLVDFPALHQGHKVWLCWRLGEPAVAHWHEFHTGFAGRLPIGPDFETPA